MQFVCLWRLPMITPELIQRINELAKKKKTLGLTDEELVEQKQLYQTYLTAFRDGFRAQLNQIKFVDEEPADRGEK
jgi:uncharacterized protein YnzC (UPF0291/DUF896 family)